MKPRASRNRAILLDKDGVLVDFHRTWLPAIKAAARAVAQGDNGLTRRLLVCVGYVPGTDTFLPGSIWAAGTQEELFARWAEELPDTPRHDIARITRNVLRNAPLRPVVPLPILRALLRQARHAGFRLAIVTNDNTSSAIRMARIFGLDGLLDTIIGPDTLPATRPKPCPDLVHLASARLGVPAASMIMIGDNSHDGEMARRAGCGLFIGVESGTSSRRDLAPLADVVMPDAATALRWLSTAGMTRLHAIPTPRPARASHAPRHFSWTRTR